jgi:hypothetical protein
MHTSSPHSSIHLSIQNLKQNNQRTISYDHVFIAMLAADITYIGLHTLTFSTVYNSNQ